MRTRFGLILKITERTKSYVSLKNAISQNHQIHKRNYHSFQGPTPIIPAQQKPFIALVDRILAANVHTDTSAFESQIDALVYRLYSLSSEEIAVVEGCK